MNGSDLGTVKKLGNSQTANKYLILITNNLEQEKHIFYKEGLFFQILSGHHMDLDIMN